MQLELFKSILSFIAPQELIDNFELVSYREHGDNIILEFEELPTLVPAELSEKDIKLCGFWNKVELQTFPQKGKGCFLHIRRRKWEDKATGKFFGNQYKLHKEGMKATNDFGAFLKKNNRI